MSIVHCKMRASADVEELSGLPDFRAAGVINGQAHRQQLTKK
jgi:hypothetical protein